MVSFCIKNQITVAVLGDEAVVAMAGCNTSNVAGVIKGVGKGMVYFVIKE